jgi:hypothetical protein
MRMGVTAAALACALHAWCSPSPRARLEGQSGTVRVQRAGQPHWLTVARPADRLLYAGDAVLTNQRSSAWLITIPDGNRMYLGPRTHVVLPGGPTAPRGNGGVIRALAGRLLIWILGDRDMEVGSAGAVASARGTKFALEVGADDVTTVTVLEGMVTFHNDLGTATVQAGQQSTAAPGRAPSRPMAVDPSQYLEWEATLDDAWLDFEMRHDPSRLPDQAEASAEAPRAKADASPNDAAAQRQAGEALHDAGDFSAAETYYRRAVGLDPAPATRVALGYSLLAQGRVAQAPGAEAEGEPTAAETEFAAAAQAAPTRRRPWWGGRSRSSRQARGPRPRPPAN